MRKGPLLRPAKVDVDGVAVIAAAVGPHGLRGGHANPNEMTARGPAQEFTGVMGEADHLDGPHAAGPIEAALVEPGDRGPHSQAQPSALAIAFLPEVGAHRRA